MLHDDRRTGDYQSALYEAVRRRGRGESCSTSHRKRDSCDSPGWAAARRVYAVEASDIAEVGERVFTANRRPAASRNLGHEP